MRIAVIGAGGVGGVFGAHLVRGGHEVAFLARGAHLAAIRDHGLTLETDDGEWTVQPFLATDDPVEIGRVDAVIVAVKTWQLDEVGPRLIPLLGEGTVVLPLQNGVEARDRLAEHLGAERVLVGLCGVISWIAGPGRVKALGPTRLVRLGEADGRRSERVERLRRALEEGGVRAEAPEDIHAALWEKFLFVVPLGGVGAVARAPLGVLRALPETRALIVDAMHEIAAVAAGAGVRLQEDAVARALRFLDGLAPSGSTSLHRDIVQGRRSELEAWNGAVVRLGRRVGVPTPVHAVLYAGLLPQERAAAGS